jgi:hypothetical protein
VIGFVKEKTVFKSPDKSGSTLCVESYKKSSFGSKLPSINIISSKPQKYQENQHLVKAPNEVYVILYDPKTIQKDLNLKPAEPGMSSFIIQAQERVRTSFNISARCRLCMTLYCV